MEASAPTGQCKSMQKWISKPLVKSCGVCGAPATDIKHYGSVVCFSCRAFFRRSILIGKEYGQCARGTNSCVVDEVNRTNCKRCRMMKCLDIGMTPDKVDKSRTNTTSQKTKAQKRFDPDVKFSIKQQNHYDQTEDQQSISIEEAKIVDIDSLAEECVFEEKNRFHFALPLEKSVPFEFTFEEEFKIHELEAVKESLLDGCFKVYLGFPNFLETVSRMLKSLTIFQEPNISKNEILAGHKRMKNHVTNELAEGGKIRKLINSLFYMFNNIPENIREETFRFSIPIVSLCLRASLKANRDKEFFVDQKRAAGLYNATLLSIIDYIFPNNRYAVRSIDNYALAIFESPWAKQQEDEQFFNSTLEAVGEIVKDDIKLGTIFAFLVLVTPGAELSDAAKKDPALIQIQHEKTLLLYRYLKSKYQDPDTASNILSRMLMLLGNLHRCRSIHLFGRIDENIFEHI